MNNILRRPFSYTYFSASLILIAVNIVIFIFTSLFPKIAIYLSLCPELFIYEKMYWQAFSYMFIHGNLMHIFFNMIGLLTFGMAVEKAFGSKEFLLMYFVCGVLTGILSLVYYISTNNYRVFLMGASGALFALLFAGAVIFPKATIYIWGVIPMPYPLLVLIYAAIEIFSQTTGYKPSVAHNAHLFGFLCAFLYFIIRIGINPFKVWKEAYFD